MGKENRINHSARIALALEKAGIKGTIITIEMTPRLRKIEKSVRNYVMEIEKAHKKAANSKLIFRSPFSPTLQPSDS